MTEQHRWNAIIWAMAIIGLVCLVSAWGQG